MRFISAAALLFSVQAYACPNLAGSYTCKYQDGSTESITIAQGQKDGVTIYVYNGSMIPADNQVHPVPDEDSLKEATFRAWCDDATTLKAQVLGKYYSEGSYFGDLTMNSEFSMVGVDLKQVTNGSLKNTGGEYPLNSELTCTRNP